MTAGNSTIDLDAYFHRIGFSGPREPTIETLQTLNRLHPKAIAFENLNPLMGWPVNLDAASLEQKLVRDGRGGYCYEHNLLFSRVLDALGFEVKNLAGRVVWGRSLDATTPLLHSLMLVSLDGVSYVADVGFGVGSLTAPLRLEANIEQPTPHETYRLAAIGDEYVVQVRIRDEWAAMYRFRIAEQFLSDIEVGNWYASTHPTALFVNELMAARADSDCRHALRNNSYVVHHLNGKSDRRTLDDGAELRATLETAFRITLPDSESLDRKLESIAHQSA